MLLIVRGHISGGEAKYAISLWKMFESGSAKPCASAVTSLVCRRKNLPISVASTGPTWAESSAASVTLLWSTLRNWPGLSKSLSPNYSEESEPLPLAGLLYQTVVKSLHRKCLLYRGFLSMIPTVSKDLF